MATGIELAAGGLGVVLGVAWLIWPTRMRNLQLTYFYPGSSGAAGEQSATGVLAGRISGAILALLGLGLVLGLLP